VIEYENEEAVNSFFFSSFFSTEDFNLNRELIKL